MLFIIKHTIMKANYIFKKILPFALLLLMQFSFETYQNKYLDSISGIVYGEKNKPIASIEIINLNNNFVAVSNKEGSFVIKGKINDELHFILNNKISKKVIITDIKNNKIYFNDLIKAEEKRIKDDINHSKKNKILYKKQDKKALKKYKRQTKREQNRAVPLIINNHEKYTNPFKNSLIGQISDDFGTLPGATIIIKGTTIGTTTDFDGYYGIDAKIGDIIQVSFTGFKSKTVKVTNAILNIKLDNNVTGDEVVITTSTSIKRKEKTVTYASDMIKSEELSFAASPKSVKSLEEKAAGVTISDKKMTTSDKIIIRGVSSAEVKTPTQKAGQLTSGEVNDFSHWEYWKGLTESELNQWKNHWKFNPTFRYSVVLTNQDGFPIINKTLHLINESNEKIWTSRTDNTGRAELWYNPNDISIVEVKENLSIIDDSKNIISDKAIEFHDGINLYQYNEKCNTSNKVNIAFMIDATGSMGDEISYLQAELNDVINRTKKALPKVDLTMGSVFYRDTTDEYLVKNFDFTSDISNVISFIQKQKAGGGGDFPEAVIEGLEASINQISWDDDARAKLLFVLLDAPPHYDAEKVLKLQELAKKAAEKGIRIIPVAASGIDKSTEYLMRAMALETNGTYLFITNHSGIGNDHIEPSTESYKVEMLNDLILRVILQYSEVKDCISNDNYPKNTKIEDQIKDDKIIKWSYYPNPTTGLVTVDVDKEATELYVFDTTGKLIFYKDEKAKQYQLDLSGLPNAIYYLKVIVDGKELFGKIIKKI